MILLISFLYFLVSCNFVVPNPVTDSNSLVTTSVDVSEKQPILQDNVSNVNPEIYSMEIKANVSNRYVKTLITSKVRNLKSQPEETTFSVILPENAFISEFEMEIAEKIYKAYVKEKEEAKQIYQQAVASGQSAAHVELNARDSKTFTVSVNIEPESKTIFRLVYEELLQRQLGQYELIINIHPGQAVKDLSVQVHINESRPLAFVKTPPLRTGNEIGKNDEKLNPTTQIDIINATSAVVSFAPDIRQQKEFAESLGGDKEKGLAGQFVVQYDVERDSREGEVLVRDGYFVHFFAPSELQPLPKHIVFVLDHSGSMSGRKFVQLVEAMKNILSDLKAGDLFNVVRFADRALVWNPNSNQFEKVQLPVQTYGHLEPHLREANLPEAVTATSENIENVKKIIGDTSEMGLTNIIEGLEVGLFLTKVTQEKHPNKFQPMIIFLTDGFPNVGISSDDEIIKTVTKLNSGENKTAIFSLAFGEFAGKDFLQKLSSKNLGFSRQIYEASDAALQLEDFYKTISSPLLSNVTFKYVDGVSQLTKTHYPIFFKGSEIVVAGKTGNNSEVLASVAATCFVGDTRFNSSHSRSIGSLERLWAYLTVKELLKERDNAEDKAELTKKALDLALKYSFVTSVTSLVVVKPNGTDSVENKPVHARDSFQPTIGMTGMPGPSAPRFLSVQNRAFLHAPRGPAYGPRQGMYHKLLSSPISISAPGLPSPPALEPIPQNIHSFSFPPSQGSYPGQPSATPIPISLEAVTTSSVPLWLQNLKDNNQNVTLPTGVYMIGTPALNITPTSCSHTVNNQTGICTPVFDCSEIFAYLPTFEDYQQYFCALNEYAGVCCPTNTDP